MKKAKRFLALVLSLVILISSGGIVLAVHYCSSKADASVTLFVAKSCCSQKDVPCDGSKSQHSFKNNCCELKISYHKVDVSSVVSAGHHFEAPVCMSDFVKVQDPSILPALLFGSLLNKAPPFYTGGKTFLYFIRNLLI